VFDVLSFTTTTKRKVSWSVVSDGVETSTVNFDAVEDCLSQCVQQCLVQEPVLAAALSGFSMSPEDYYNSLSKVRRESAFQRKRGGLDGEQFEANMFAIFQLASRSEDIFNGACVSDFVENVHDYLSFSSPKSSAKDLHREQSLQNPGACWFFPKELSLTYTKGYERMQKQTKASGAQTRFCRRRGTSRQDDLSK